MEVALKDTKLQNNINTQMLFLNTKIWVLYVWKELIAYNNT
jgi:hypothetical protein